MSAPALPAVLRGHAPGAAAARRIAVGVAVVLGLVVVTGAAVRLTGSGLGCPTWPTCHGGDFVSTTSAHGLIEFGNRVLSVGVFLAGIVALAYVVVRRGRRDLYGRVGLLFGGYLAEAVLGGFTVLTRLNPLLVALHFLLAIGLLWVALVVQWRLRPDDARPDDAQAPATALDADGIARWLRPLARLQVAGAVAVLVVGTLVTGTGPHAGSRVDNRLPFDRGHITQLHSDLALLLVGLVVATALAAHLSGAPRGLRRRTGWLAATLVAQAVVGFAQYAAGLPAWLVGVHVAGATVVFALATLFLLDLSPLPPLRQVTPPAVARPDLVSAGR